MKVAFLGPRPPKQDHPTEISWDLGLDEPVYLSFWVDRQEVSYSIRVTESDTGQRELSIALV